MNCQMTASGSHFTFYTPYTHTLSFHFDVHIILFYSDALMCLWTKGCRARSQAGHLGMCQMLTERTVVDENVDIHLAVGGTSAEHKQQKITWVCHQDLHAKAFYYM